MRGSGGASYKKLPRLFSFYLISSALQHGHDGVAGFAAAGLIDGQHAVFGFLAAGLIDERDFGFEGGGDIGPVAVGAVAALDLVGGGGAAVHGFFPVEEDPAGALARGFEFVGWIEPVKPIKG